MAAVHSHVARRPTRLAASLRSRHVNMIAFGGIIGAGIFVGSGQIVAQAGPGVVISYLIAGLLAIAVMRMLSALSMNEPTTAAFARYSGRAFGWVGGFTIGWLYWWEMVVTVGLECSAAVNVLRTWLPGVSPWVVALVLMAGFTAMNLLPVRAFGETQFWFSAIKVIALAVIMLAGLLAAFGVLPGVSSPGVGNLTGQGGFLPHGASAVLTGVLVAVFSFVGVELPAIAAGEARSPQATVRGSMRGVPPTTTILYVGVMLAVVTMVPWNGTGAANSPAAALLSALGVPHAAQIVDVLVLLAVLTVLNSCLWAASRMAFALAGQGDAPGGLSRLSPKSVPSRAVILTGLMAFGTVAVQYFAPNGVFLVLEDSAGAVGLVVWLAIAGAYLKLRPVAKPWRTYVAWAVVVIICAMLVTMVLVAQTRSQILATLSLAVIIVVIALWRDTI